MIKIEQLKLPLDHTEEELEVAIEKRVGRKVRNKNGQACFRILKKSLDCRKKPELYYIYSIGVFFDKKTEALVKKSRRAGSLIFAEETVYSPPVFNKEPGSKRPVIVGDGPAGLFCAYILTLAGACPVVLERGGDVDQRTETVKNFWENGQLDPGSNVQFGEGGAGTFSDGKLNSGIKDRAGRIAFVLETFVKFGAKEEILYDSKPHIGTDELRRIIRNMRLFLEERGCEFRFNSKVSDLILEDGKISGVIYEPEKGSRDDHEKPEKNGPEKLLSDTVVLAIGHSSRDTLEMLYDRQIRMERKDFAMGFRVMHPQKLIDFARYGRELFPADYKLAVTTGDGTRVYSFCMCPGGYVVNASSEEGRLCVNGMSYADRSSKEANSAIVAAFKKEDFGSEDPLSGMYLQRRIEEKAYALCKGKIPTERFVDFKDSINGRENIRKAEDVPERNGGAALADHKPIRKLQIKGAYAGADLSTIFDDKVNRAIVEAMEAFDRQIKGFAGEEAVFAGVESRTSSPVRILRDEESFMGSVYGLYPCGEGAGYAGGIMSAAVDGIKTAEHILRQYNDF
ncbi:MAG: FAD-dependent oxidoreductase [Lachnospiraceae bacterium]|nr:FAD-dependent oxidoreductase [Lachnospiraceae bacterium]